MHPKFESPIPVGAIIVNNTLSVYNIPTSNLGLLLPVYTYMQLILIVETAKIAAHTMRSVAYASKYQQQLRLMGAL